MRPVRISLLTACVASIALATAGPGAESLAAAASPGTDVSEGKLTVKLHVSTNAALQFHGVLMQALPSNGDVIAYAFVFGDGTKDEYTYQPYAEHAYAKPGTYHAKVAVVDASDQGAISKAVTIHVSDSIPPVVRINRPSPGQRLHLGKGGLDFSGSATDANGVAKVEIAIQLVSSRRHFATGGNCIWYDGKTWLVLASCSAPHYVVVPHGQGRWSFHMSSKARIPAGTYEIQVRAIDHAGNISHYYAPSLHTILEFELTR